MAFKLQTADSRPLKDKTDAKIGKQRAGKLDKNWCLQKDVTHLRERAKVTFRVVDLIKINRVRWESNHEERVKETLRYSFNGINTLGISAGSVAVSMVTHLSPAGWLTPGDLCRFLSHSLIHTSFIPSVHITPSNQFIQPFLEALFIKSPVIHLDSLFSLILPPVSSCCPSSVPLTHLVSPHTCFLSHYLPPPLWQNSPSWVFCTLLLKTAHMPTHCLAGF